MAGKALSARVEELLAQLDGDADTRAVLERVIDEISAASGCESVGIRWKAGDDYPYYVTRGFGRDFIIREGPLCERNAAGLILRHPDGTPQLACMCGAVVQGRTDPRLPIFTPGGSFWTNGTTQLLREAPPAKTMGTRTRNYCNEVGYESVALIPLRLGDRACGLLQLNSRTPGRFTEQQISEYERLAQRIAEAARGRVDESEGRPLPV